MRIGRLLAGVLLVAVGAFAQESGPTRVPGRGGHMGFGPPPGPGARFLGAEAGMFGRVVKNAPYSADIVTESTQTLADGNHIRQSTTAKFYRDSEGRTRSEQSVNLNGLASNSNLPPIVFINDPVANVAYALNTTNHTMTKVLRGRGRGGLLADQAQAALRRGPGQPHQPENVNVKTEALGRQTIEGVPADGTRTTLTIPAGQMGNELPLQIVTESWYSADLHTEILYKHSDPRMGETVRRLVNISRSEPARTLFDAPADYKLIEPGDRAAGLAGGAQK